MSTVIEMVSFKLFGETKEQQILATNPIMEEFLNAQPGFMYRSLSQNNDTWYDIVYWKDQRCALDAATAFKTSAICSKMMPLIDQASCEIIRMRALSEILSDTLAKNQP